MDEIQDKIDSIETDADIVKDLYELIEQYQVPVNPEDLAVYQVHTSYTKSLLLCILAVDSPSSKYHCRIINFWHCHFI